MTEILILAWLYLCGGYMVLSFSSCSQHFFWWEWLTLFFWPVAVTLAVVADVLGRLYGLGEDD